MSCTNTLNKKKIKQIKSFMKGGNLSLCISMEVKIKQRKHQPKILWTGFPGEFQPILLFLQLLHQSETFDSSNRQ